MGMKMLSDWVSNVERVDEKWKSETLSSAAVEWANLSFFFLPPPSSFSLHYTSQPLDFLVLCRIALGVKKEGKRKKEKRRGGDVDGEARWWSEVGRRMNPVANASLPTTFLFLLFLYTKLNECKAREWRKRDALFTIAVSFFFAHYVIRTPATLESQSFLFCQGSLIPK